LKGNERNRTRSARSISIWVLLHRQDKRVCAKQDNRVCAATQMWLSDSIYPLLSKFPYPHFAAIPPIREPPKRIRKAARKPKKRTALRKEHPRARETSKTQPSHPYYPTTRKAPGRSRRDNGRGSFATRR
jgi:hypothetical protein